MKTKIDKEIDLILKNNCFEKISNAKQKREVEVSVFVLCYNHEQYLKRFFESVLKQKTDFGVEIVINDDSSTDGSRDIIEKYYKKYPNIIIPIFQKTNRCSTDRSIIYKDLFKHSKGKYISFCESDDFFEDEYKLVIQHTLLERYQEANFSAHVVNKINSNDRTKIGVIPNISIKSGIYKDRDMFKLVSEYHHPQTSSYFFRRESFVPFLDKIDELKRIVTFDDLSILMLGIYNSKYLFINRPMSNYSAFVDGGWMSKQSALSIDKKIDNYYSCLEYYKFIDEKTSHRFSKYFKNISFDRKLSIKILQNDYKSIFLDHHLKKSFKKRGLKNYYAWKLKTRHNILYNYLRKVFCKTNEEK